MTEDRRTLIIDADLSRGVAALDMFSEKLDAAGQAAERIAPAIDAADEKAKKLAGGSVKDFWADVKAVRDEIRGWADAFNEAVEMVQKVVAGVQALDKAMASTFAQRNIEANLTIGIDGARRSTLGLVDDLTLSRMAIEAQRLKVVESSEDFEKLTSAATKLGLSVGRDATSSVESLVGALGRGETELLDNLGVTLKASEAQRLYAEQLGISTKALTEDQKAEAFRVIGLQKAVEAAENVTIATTESEDAWIRARQQYDAIVRETLPAVTGELDGLWSALADGGEIARDVLPGLIKYLALVAEGLKPLMWMVGFFGKQLAAAGRVLELVSDKFDDLSESAGEAGDKIGGWLADTDIGKWAIKSKDEIAKLVGEGIEDLTASIRKHVPYAEEVADSWDEVARAITGAKAELHEMSAIADAQAKIVGFFSEAKQNAKDTAAAEAQRVATLRDGVTESEHQVRLAEAQQKPAADLEKLYREQYKAKLALLEATGDQAAIEKLQRDEEVRQAKNTRRGGGRGPTEADRVKAAGEIRIAYLRDALALQEAEAELWGTSAADAERFAEIRHQIAIEALRAEQAALEVTRAKNSVERERSAARIEAIDREIEILDVQRDAAVQLAAIEDKRAGIEQRIADLDREIERNEALGVSIRLLQQTRDEAALALAALDEDGEALKQERHDQWMLRMEAEREAKVLEAEDELLRFDQRMELLEAEGIAVDEYAQARLDLEERIAKAEGDTEALRQINHKRELARKKLEKKTQEQNVAATRGLLGSTMQMGDLVLQHAIKNDAKRERAALRLKGVMAIATAALETVEGVAAIARYDFLGAAAHFAAATLGYVQGTIMMAGNVPSQGGGGAAMSGGGGGGGSGFGAEFQRNTDQRDRPSTPASAEELTRIRGGYNDQPAANDSGKPNGGTTINAGIIVSGDDGYLLGRVGNDDKRRWGS